jgi:bacillithiol biosynthesis cysteine-adding enzyme BshC
MQVKSYPIESLHSFSKLLIDYLAEFPALSKFYGNAPKLEEFEKQIAEKKSFSYSNRTLLHEVIEGQYKDIGQVVEIESILDENTYTVTTGHQLNIFTGPLYVIYKIVSTINLAKKLKIRYPKANFIPVYWMATEDHDWDEINHFYWLDKKFEVSTSQRGAVGRFSLSEFEPFLKELPTTLSAFQKAYSQAKNLSQAVRMYMHELFGDQGLICLDADDSRLKFIFAPIILADLFDNSHLVPVENASNSLSEMGYKTQINAREINLFYLIDGVRERIEKRGEIYHVLHTAITFSSKELQEEVAKFPERFSPNVVLRPLYQEMILPNLAYIGGPAEVGYWLQLKGIFDLHQVPFPILLPRNFAIILREKHQQKISKLGIGLTDLFLDDFLLRRKFVASQSRHVLDCQSEINLISPIFNALAKRVKLVDSTLEASVKAEFKRLENGLERMGKKLNRAEERNHETSIRQLNQLKTALFPEGQWQERHENFLNYYLEHPAFIQQLLDTFDPLLFEMYAIDLD